MKLGREFFGFCLKKLKKTGVLGGGGGLF